MRYLPCGPPLVGTALMPVGRHAIHFTITCGVLRKPAGRVNSLNTLPYRVPVLNDRPAIREISPPWHPDDLLVPFTFSTLNQTRRWCATQTIGRRDDRIVYLVTCTGLGQVSTGLREGVGGHTSAGQKQPQRACEELGSSGFHSATGVRPSSKPGRNDPKFARHFEGYVAINHGLRQSGAIASV
jgi:hypothetical protein